MRLLTILVASMMLLAHVQSQPLDSALTRPAAGRDTVVIGISQEPVTLNPITETSAVSPSILQTIFTRDVQRNADWKPFAQGVESLPDVRRGTWRVNGDQMILFWKLRSRKWHDGKPVTCSDYVFSHALQRSEKVPGLTLLIAPRIANVSCPKGAGGTEIAVAWKERYAYANLQIIEIGPLPRHLLEPLVRASPSRFVEIYGVDAKATLGDGAYRLVEWHKSQSITVESVGSHPIFRTPQIKRISWQIMRSDRLVTAMLSGAIDAIGEHSLDSKLAVELERQGAGRIKVFFEPGLAWEHLDFNLDNSFLRDIRIRRAIAHGINRTQIVQTVFQGKAASVSHTYLPPKHPGYTDAIQSYPYDPPRARALLEEAGFILGSDGIMRDASGRRLSLEFNTTAGNPERERVQQNVQQQLRQIGIEVTILNYSRRVLFGELLTRRKFSAISMYGWLFEPDSDCNLLYTSDGIPREQNNWEGANFVGYANPEMDKLCKAAAREVDEQVRNRLLKESARIFARDLPALPLFVFSSLGAAKSGLRNFRVVGLSNTKATWNAHTWYWD